MAFNISNMNRYQYSNEDLRKDEMVFGEKKYIMKIIKIEVGNARGHLLLLGR